MENPKLRELLKMIGESRRSKLTLHLDENLLTLEQPLRLFNLKVITYPSGLADDQIIKNLSGDTLITNNVKDFKKHMVINDFDIIDVREAFIDTEQSIKNKTAKAISKAITQSGYTLLKGNWIIKITSELKYTITKV
jgi:hypothetical protein